MDPLPSPDEVQSWLEWAGQRLLSIQVIGTRPSSYRSFWPDYPDDPHTAYGYTNSQLRPPALSSSEVSLMDKVFDLVLLVPVPLQRRVLNARALVNPINGRYVYSWHKIAVLIHSERRTVKTLHQKGLTTISYRVPPSIAEQIRLRVDPFSGPSLSC